MPFILALHDCPVLTVNAEVNVPVVTISPACIGIDPLWLDSTDNRCTTARSGLPRTFDPYPTSHGFELQDKVISNFSISWIMLLPRCSTDTRSPINNSACKLHILAQHEHPFWTNVNTHSGRTWTLFLVQREHLFWREGEHFRSMTRIGVHDTRIDFLHWLFDC